MTDYSQCKRIQTEKVVLYLDVYPGFEKKHAIATANPGQKSDGSTRYRIEVYVPDWNEPSESVEAKIEREPELEVK